MKVYFSRVRVFVAYQRTTVWSPENKIIALETALHDNRPEGAAEKAC